MKKLLQILSILTALLCSVNCMAMTDSNYDLTVYVEENHENPDPNRGQRAPQVPLLCSISVTDGLRISGIDNSLIESFEIRDGYGNTIAVLSDEASFIDIVFSLHGEYRIIFYLNDRTLSGWINVGK
ncbi:MAG: hypothetical protein K2K58_01680 [Muribaculaceae bacterium]|nr:hypothetical protein [Muribaculaceae bacterium]